MAYGLNKPLTSAQVKLLGLGFTPTSVGLTGQQIKRAGRTNGHVSSNAPRTRGRQFQIVPLALRDEHGDVLRDIKGQVIYSRQTKQIWHKA